MPYLFPAKEADMSQPIVARMPENGGSEVRAVDVTRWLAFIPQHAAISHDGTTLVAVWTPQERI